MPTQRVFSGIQPSGIPQLGNYLGAIRHWVRLQSDYSCLFCLVDMHAITVWQNPEELRHHTLTQAAVLLASGIDAQKHILFNQSAVFAHARLGWIFNCITRLGWLNRMTQFKDKTGKDRENYSSGLYVYPNLMAADILAYKATHVPVGEDQKQHLELTNDIAQKFNHDYSVAFFPQVKPLIPPTAARIMSLRDGTKKMSKSDPSSQSRIDLTDDADTIRLKIRRAKTDTAPLPDHSNDLTERPEAKNLVSIYAALTNTTIDHVLETYQGKGFSVFKADLTEVVINAIVPIGQEAIRLLKNETYLLEILRNGADRASTLANPVVSEVEKIVGFLS